MRTLSEMEVDHVSGGLCDDLSIAQCFAGVVDQVAAEIKALGGYMGEAWDAWCDFNDVGIWLYNVTHQC
jgi:hypothetical protein